MEKLVQFFMGFSGPSIFALVFLLLLACGFGLPMPEDITLFAAGYLCYLKDLNVYLMIFVSLFGVMLGDSGVFYLGKKYGIRLTRRWFFAKVLHPERMDMIKARFQSQGNRLIFAARFMPGLRAPVFFCAGTLGVPFRVFFFYDGLAALISVPAIVYSVYYFGHTVDEVIHVIKKVEFGIVIVILSIAAIMVAKWFYQRRRQAVS